MAAPDSRRRRPAFPTSARAARSSFPRGSAASRRGSRSTPPRRDSSGSPRPSVRAFASRGGRTSSGAASRRGWRSRRARRPTPNCSSRRRRRRSPPAWTRWPGAVCFGRPSWRSIPGPASLASTIPSTGSFRTASCAWSSTTTATAPSRSWIEGATRCGSPPEATRETRLSSSRRRALGARASSSSRRRAKRCRRRAKCCRGRAECSGDRSSSHRSISASPIGRTCMRRTGATTGGWGSRCCCGSTPS